MIFATGLHDPEGPLLLDDGDWLVTEMHPEHGCVTHLSATGDRLGTVVHTGRPNGLARAADGTLWITESLTPAILRVRGGGEAETVVSSCEGIDLLWPNDLCFGSDGLLYFTDSGIDVAVFAADGAVGPDELDARKTEVTRRVDGRLFRLDPRSGRCECLAEGLRFPNGIAFAPDGSLHVSETIGGDIVRFTFDPSFRIRDRSVHANVLVSPESPAWQGPDGMAFDVDGRLYVGVLGQGDLTVVEPDGAIAARHVTAGSLPTNVAFGPPGTHSVYVTEDVSGTIEVFGAQAGGLPLHTGSAS